MNQTKEKILKAVSMKTYACLFEDDPDTWYKTDERAKQHLSKVSRGDKVVVQLDASGKVITFIQKFRQQPGSDAEPKTDDREASIVLGQSANLAMEVAKSSDWNFENESVWDKYEEYCEKFYLRISNLRRELLKK